MKKEENLLLFKEREGPRRLENDAASHLSKGGAVKPAARRSRIA